MSNPAPVPANQPLARMAAYGGRDIGESLTIFVVFTVLGVISARWLGEGYASLVFVFGITVIGAVSGLTLAVISAVVGAITFNFFVAAPVFELNLNRGSDFIPPLVFTLCAVISGLLSGRLKDQSARVQRSNQRLESLLDASRRMQAATDIAEVFAAVRQSIRPALGMHLAFYRLDNMVPIAVHNLTETAVPPAQCDALAAEVAVHQVEMLSRGGLSAYLLAGSNAAVGVMVTDAPDGAPGQAGVDAGFLAALARVIGLALERAALAGQVASQMAEVRALARTEELKTNLLSSVSHDLRTPLTTIATAAASLLTFGDRMGADTRDDLLRDIVGECDRLNHLTANLLELTRLQSGAAKLRVSVIPTAEMIRAIMKVIKPQAGGRVLTLTAPRDEVLVAVDIVLFDLALGNVLQNAVRYSLDNSAIRVDCRIEGGECVIAVTDDGPGIAPAEQDKVFERFYRGAAGARPGTIAKGSGLGLAIAKGFVEASGGTIGIASPVADGRGTTILIRLPRIIADNVAGGICDQDDAARDDQDAAA